MNIGRNSPCRCGSTKKYKRCCGKNADKGGSPVRIAPTKGERREALQLQMMFALMKEAERERLERLALRRQQYGSKYDPTLKSDMLAL